MEFSVEKKISNFVESQFPQFYLDEGENFVTFVKAYYEWMESEGNPIAEARNLFDYRDIDNTLEAFLEHFQRKYLYGIPFNTIINKRFLLKHILDVYRSKGSIQCYKLLFRLIYNEDVDIYLPGEDVLRLSDGTWRQPLYLEVSDSEATKSFVGKRIIGLGSGVTATVENYAKEPVAENIISTLRLSSILPRGGEFIKGEKVLLEQDKDNGAAILQAPIILGSLLELDITNGGQNFLVGEQIKIAHRDPDTGAPISYGVDGVLKILQTTAANGIIKYNIASPGFGITANAQIFSYNPSANGSGASFELGALSYGQSITYNTDFIVDYLDTPINSATYGFPANNTANSATIISFALSYANQVFGSLATLSNIKSGQNYDANLNIFIRSTLDESNYLSGNVSYNTTSNTVTGSNTTFTRYFNTGSRNIIALQANGSNSATKEYAVVKQVVNDTTLVLWGPPSQNSTSSAKYKISPVILPSNFATYEPVMYRTDGTINGRNTVVTGTPRTGNGVVSKVRAVNSGKGYIQDEQVTAYLYAGLSQPVVLNGGVGYSNGEILIFSNGGGFEKAASGFVTTNANGTITGATLTYAGSGYTKIPFINVRTKNGSGAAFSTTVNEFNLTAAISGKVKKAGIGKKIGYWDSDRGFLDSNKYIQDSYFYQDFSYQVRTAATLDKYKNILYKTFHTAGNELFGAYNKVLIEPTNFGIGEETTTPIFILPAYITVDDVGLKTDSTYFTADQL
jgi:hypothetical protein